MCNLNRITKGADEVARLFVVEADDVLAVESTRDRWAGGITGGQLSFM